MRDGGKIYSHQIFPMSPLESAIWALLLTQKLPRRGKSELFECCYTWCLIKFLLIHLIGLLDYKLNEMQVKLTLWNVYHGTGRLCVRRSARVVARVDIRYVSYCQLTSDGAPVPLLVVRLLNVRVIHQVTVDFGDHFHSRPGPRSGAASVSAAAAASWLAVARRLGRRNRVGRRVVINHSVVVIPEDELRLLRNLSWKNKEHGLQYFNCSAADLSLALTFLMMQVNWMALPLSTWYSLPPTIEVDGTTTLTL